MLLSLTTQYGLRTMVALSTSNNQGPLQAKEISKLVSVPDSYLSKVLRRLVTAGLLKGTKGHGGGFIIAKSISQIKISDIVKALEPTQVTKHCIFGWRICSDKVPCVLHLRWSKVNKTFLEWTFKTSLADIQKDAKKMDWLLTVDPTDCKPKKVLRSNK